MDFLEELAHSWGKSPEQKKREKEYNAKYYRENKERWKNVTTGNTIPDSLKEYVKDAQKSGSYTYLPQGVYPKNDKEEREWNAAGFSYDENKGVWKWTSSAEKHRRGVQGNTANAYAENEKAKLDAARKRYGRVNYNIANVDYVANEKAKLEAAKKRADTYKRKKPYLDSLAASKAEQNVSAAKKARKFIDGYVEYTASSMKANSKKIKPAVSQGVQFVKDFFGVG